MNIDRTGFVLAVAALTLAPRAAFSASQDQKRKFISQCDESISVDRLAGAPYKFVGKKVDLHGIVGPATDPDYINLNSANDPGVFVIVLASSRNLEQGQRIRVLGTVRKPVSGQNNIGGSGTYAVVEKAYIE